MMGWLLPAREESCREVQEVGQLRGGGQEWREWCRTVNKLRVPYLKDTRHLSLTETSVLSALRI